MFDFNISEWMLKFFGPYGAIGIIVFVALIFFIDAVFFPTLPELFFVIGFMYMPGDIMFGIAFPRLGDANSVSLFSELYIFS